MKKFKISAIFLSLLMTGMVNNSYATTNENDGVVIIADQKLKSQPNTLSKEVLMNELSLHLGKQKVEVKNKIQTQIEELYCFIEEEKPQTLHFTQELCFEIEKENMNNILDLIKPVEENLVLEVKINKIAAFDLENIDQPLIEIELKNYHSQILEIKQV